MAAVAHHAPGCRAPPLAKIIDNAAFLLERKRKSRRLESGGSGGGARKPPPGDARRPAAVACLPASLLLWRRSPEIDLGYRGYGSTRSDRRAAAAGERAPSRLQEHFNQCLHEGLRARSLSRSLAAWWWRRSTARFRRGEHRINLVKVAAVPRENFNLPRPKRTPLTNATFALFVAVVLLKFLKLMRL